ncbi:MAG: ABC transporter ATP-binding protein/permease [Anaerolineae bacterium]|nr:ABC transporter ATP-binding protein/permease [Anaerolineae bacterium]
MTMQSPRARGERVSYVGLQRAIRYLGRYRRVAVIAYTSLFLSILAQLIVPQLVEATIDTIARGVTQPDAETWLMASAIGIVGFAVMRGVFAFSQAYNAERVSQGVAFDLRNELFAKIQRLSFSYHDQAQTGQLMIRATDDVEKVRIFIGQGLMMALQAFVFLFGTLIVLWLTNATLTLVVLPTLPIAMILFFTFGAVSQPLFMRVQQKLSALNTILQENLAGIKVVKAFVREASEQARFARAADELMHQQLVISRVFSFLFPFIFLIANLGQAAVLYFGGQQILAGTLTIGEWQKFSLYLVFVFFPLGQLGFIVAQMSQASASAARIFEILDTRSEVSNKPNAITLPPIRGHVKFENVTFRYFGSDRPVLSRVSFEALPGQTIALLGATGSGKTTIINLIPRFYDVTEGRVLIDGYDVREVTLESLRSQIGVVLQDATLFSGTIRDNIAFGRPDATLDEVIAAARAADAHEFITSFPNGYDTLVGERGQTLSGGQKQRIAIARALLLNPRILILDDSTSSVDYATERRIQHALDRLMKGRTSFVIAQRISTVQNADQILVLDKGEIVARGTHAELLEESELYAEIYYSQLTDDARMTDDRRPKTDTSSSVIGHPSSVFGEVR